MWLDLVRAKLLHKFCFFLALPTSSNDSRILRKRAISHPPLFPPKVFLKFIFHLSIQLIKGRIKEQYVDEEAKPSQISGKFFGVLISVYVKTWEKSIHFVWRRWLDFLTHSHNHKLTLSPISQMDCSSYPSWRSGMQQRPLPFANVCLGTGIHCGMRAQSQKPVGLWVSVQVWNQVHWVSLLHPPDTGEVISRKEVWVNSQFLHACEISHLEGGRGRPGLESS